MLNNITHQPELRKKYFARVHNMQ